MSDAITIGPALTAFAGLHPYDNVSFAGHLKTLSVHQESGRVNKAVLEVLERLSLSQLAFCAQLLERCLRSSPDVASSAVVVLGKLRGLTLKVPDEPEPPFWDVGS